MTELYPGIFFSSEEISAARRMAADGVRIWLQKVPNSTLLEWENIQNKL